MHEMLHVLGYNGKNGTPLKNWYHLLDHNTPNKKFYVGRYGAEAFNHLQIQQCNKTVYPKLPMTPDGSHLSEDILGDELMTPFYGGKGVLSNITLGILEDLGYIIDKTQAEQYKLPSCEKKNATDFLGNCKKVTTQDVVTCPEHEAAMNKHLADYLGSRDIDGYYYDNGGDDDLPD